MDASWITLNIYTLSIASISIVEPVFLAISPMAIIDRFDDSLLLARDIPLSIKQTIYRYF